MKKMTFLACAAMLTSAVALTGCKDGKNEPQQKAPTVTTDIALSLPGQVGANGARRMPGTTVQKSGYSDFETNGMKNIILVPFAPSADVTTSSTRHGDNIELDNFSSATAYSQSADGRAKLYESKQVPAGTSAFLFYGVSGATGTKFQKGSLAFGNSTLQPTNFVFELEAINANTSDILADDAYKGLIAYLNHVANATDGVKAWKNYTAGDNEGFYELFQEYSRANVLSSFGIERMMDDLYQNLKLNTTDALASAIRDSIAKADSPYARLDGEGHVKLQSALTGFPASFDLPDGAVAVAYSAGAFDGNAAHAYGSLAPAQLDRYVYPAELWYFANTRIKTSTTSKKSSYESPASWKAILATYEKDNSSVNAKTRSIALKDTIQYAVARLDVRVQIGGTTNLVDNNPVEASRNVPNPIAGYPVSAVIIGGQKNVGFDFTPATYNGIEAKKVAYTIYDNVMTSTMSAVESTFSPMNSTLVLETAAEQDQFIAIELTNNSGQDFYGFDGIVPKGGKFYLVGKLTAADATETELKVFKQDYTTTANLTIVNLKNAFNTIPDLKAPQLEIGLSVDLSWSAGHTYNVNL